MTPTTLDMTRTKSLIESEMHERFVWDTGGYWIDGADPTVMYSGEVSAVYDSREAAIIGQGLLEEYEEPERVTVSEALREAKDSGDTLLLLLDETMTVIESWPVR